MTQRLHAFLSPRRVNVTQWANYLPQRVPQRAKVLPQRSNLSRTIYLNGRRFDSTIARFSFVSTGKCNSMQWSNYLPQRAKVLAQRSNLTPQRAKNIANQRANITQWSNYLPQRAEILSQRSQRAKNIVNQWANIATDEKYCEWAAKHIKISCLPREY